MIDYGKMELFATPVYTAMIPDFDEYRNDIIDYARQYKSKYETVHVSNVGGYQSSSDIHQDPDFRSVCDRIWETVLLPGCDLMSDAFAERGFQGTKFRSPQSLVQLQPKRCLEYATHPSTLLLFWCPFGSRHQKDQVNWCCILPMDMHFMDWTTMSGASHLKRVEWCCSHLTCNTM